MKARSYPRLVFVAFFALGITILIEGACRFFARTYLTRPIIAAADVQTQEDMLLHHVWVPDRVIIDRFRDIPYPLIINGQSWVEEYNVKREKGPNIYRVFYLGDSNTQGVVAPEYKMVELVEKGLNLAYADSPFLFEVVNTGTSSYSFLQYYLLTTKKLLDYGPDLVVINVDMSDVANNAVYRRLAVFGNDGQPLAIPPKASARYILTPEGHAKLCNQFVLPHLLTNYSDFFYLVDIAARALRISFATKNVDKSANWLAMEWSKSVQDEVNHSMTVLKSTLRFLKSHGIKVLVTGMPFYGQYTGQLSTRPHYILAKTAADEGVPFLNSYEALKEYINGTSAGRYYWNNDPTHFNIDGNRLWAEAQLNFLLSPEHNLLPLKKQSFN